MSEWELIQCEYNLAKTKVWNKVHRLRLINTLNEKKSTRLTKLWDV